MQARLPNPSDGAPSFERILPKGRDPPANDRTAGRSCVPRDNWTSARTEPNPRGHPGLPRLESWEACTNEDRETGLSCV